MMIASHTDALHTGASRVVRFPARLWHGWSEDLILEVMEFAREWRRLIRPVLSCMYEQGQCTKQNEYDNGQ